MKKLFLFFSLLPVLSNINAQNVGIGTSNPTYPLTVAAYNNKGITQKNGDVEIGYYTNNNSAWLQTWSNHPIYFATNNGLSTMAISTAGNVGIGLDLSNPQYQLDLGGRLRIRHTPSNTAGIWFDGTSQPVRSFIGTINNEHVGIFGNAGVGWNIAMNVANGNTGIGTSAPTATLDVNGTLRFRSSIPKKGSVLTSEDANGNTSWADPVAFRAVGGLNGQNNAVNDRIWTKIFFNQTTHHNLGLNYQPLLSQFLVAENGIYHFDIQLHWNDAVFENGVRIMITRSGNTFVVAENYRNYAGVAGTVTNVYYHQPSTISTDANLSAGDLIWVEAFVDSPNNITSYVSANGNLTWFSGHLIARY